MLRRPSPDGVQMVRAMVDKMTLPELKSYETYLMGAGYPLGGVKAIETAISLHERGWLTKVPNLLDPAPIYFSRRAWDRFQLAEWDLMLI